MLDRHGGDPVLGAVQKLAGRDGTIRGFSLGIDLTKTDFGRIEGVRLVDNAFGLDKWNGILVKDCIVADNAKASLRATRAVRAFWAGTSRTAASRRQGSAAGAP